MKGRDMRFRRIFAGLLFALVAAPLVAGDELPPEPMPALPMRGTDADVRIYPDSAAKNRMGAGDQNIRIVSKIGADMQIENNINVGGNFAGDSFSGGANLTQPYQAPAGFNPYVDQADMAFMLTEMPEDDGAAVLSISKTNRKNQPERRVFAPDRNAILTGIEVGGDDARAEAEAMDQVR